jgi:hypothetical protein
MTPAERTLEHEVRDKEPQANETMTEQIARLKALVRDLDPDVLAAVDDVDRSLVRASLALSPLERLEASFALLEGLRRFRRVPASR